ncbi:MAG: hypothetical protein RLZZ242_1417 [Bacteroidota bacterium]|jgi:uncharacterized protein YyaL (SSP411 family)
MAKRTNALSKASSPYLKQHQYNPVEWVEYADDLLAKAQRDQKLLLISIGYAACHWCHVMERECFEDEGVAKLMNRYFICIKIDREERPDIDHLYMDALQLMTGSGGWPLNIVALPDGRPFWGATYLPKERWVAALSDLQQLFVNERERVLEYATSLSRGLKAMAETPSVGEQHAPWGTQDFELVFDTLLKDMDTEYGGFKGAPKFMMPSTLEFALHAHLTQSNEALFKQLQITLDRMSYGALFDPINGGFSRYSVDHRWHVVHFEKMAYDNAQLLSLYAKTFAVTKNNWYQQVALKTFEFLKDWLYDSNLKGFYASIDADSMDASEKLVEGAYYRFTLEELQSALGDLYERFAQVYHFDTMGHWENGYYLLFRTQSNFEIAKTLGISIETLELELKRGFEQLKQVQQKRNKPACDHKILSSWNALIVSSLTHCYRYLEVDKSKKDEFFSLASATAQMLSDRIAENGRLWRVKNTDTAIDGVLEDYALCIQCFIDLYELSFDSKYMEKAEQLTHFVFEHFKGPEGFFYYTSDLQKQLVRRTIEVEDNVISSSNAVMARNLYRLGALLATPELREQASALLAAMRPQMIKHPRSYSFWLQVALLDQLNFYKIAIIGEDALQLASEIQRHFLPNTVLSAAKRPTSRGLLNRTTDLKQTFIFACINGSCSLPLTTAEALLNHITHDRKDI